MQSDDPQFFRRLAQQQAPEYLWIGCSDSRVPSNQILDLAPGEVFTHRNVANLVPSGDLNCLSVLQFAIDVLKVRHVMIVGHLGCGGIKAALDGTRHGLVDTWLRHVQEVHVRHEASLAALPAGERADRLCELNVAEQFANLSRIHIVNDAWRRGQALSIHGLVYGLNDGLLRELGLSAENRCGADQAYCAAVARITSASEPVLRSHTEP